jgi:hypothetical protein
MAFLAAVAQDKSLTVFAAASMKNVLDDINAAYTAKTGVEIVNRARQLIFLHPPTPTGWTIRSAKRTSTNQKFEPIFFKDRFGCRRAKESDIIADFRLRYAVVARRIGQPRSKRYRATGRWATGHRARRQRFRKTSAASQPAMIETP